MVCIWRAERKGKGRRPVWRMRRTFGSFVVRSKKERMGRNPKTKTSAVIKARRVVSFKCSPELARRMNGTALEEE